MKAKKINMKKLYLTEMAANGTNDLLITENGRITGCILEATMGYPNSFKVKPNAMTKETSDRVTGIKGFHSKEHTFLYEVTAGQVLEYLVESDEGSPVVEELEGMGFSLESA
jgi:hypothetical protein